jgi:putative mRNA 3-end processing factor
MSPLVETRPEGLYCPAGDFYIDPWQPVREAVITHAHADHARPGSQRYPCAEQGLPLLQSRLGYQRFVAHAYGESFDLGRARVSLHPAGHMLGSAQVRIEAAGRCWVVSGDYKRDPDPTCAPFEVLPCDGLLTEATFALPVYRWTPTQEVMDEILDWWRGCRERDETAVLFCYAVGKAQRVLAELANRLPRKDWPGHRVFLHGAMAAPTAIYRDAGVTLLPTTLVADNERGACTGGLVLAPPSAAGSPWMRRFARPSTGFASGWMKLRGNRRRRGFDRGFVVSDHADWPSLLRTVEESGARQVLATHGNSHSFVRFLRERGMDASELHGPFGGGDS